MKKNKLLPLVVLALIATTDVQAGGLTLSYELPSPSWMGSLPLGNGRLGAMVYGGTGTETIALSEVTL